MYKWLGRDFNINKMEFLQSTSSFLFVCFAVCATGSGISTLILIISNFTENWLKFCLSKCSHFVKKFVDYTQVHVSRIYRDANKRKGTWARVVFIPPWRYFFLFLSFNFFFFSSWLFCIPLTVSLKNIFLSQCSLTLLKTYKSFVQHFLQLFRLFNSVTHAPGTLWAQHTLN